jgi:hypothetical protein
MRIGRLTLTAFIALLSVYPLPLMIALWSICLLRRSNRIVQSKLLVSTCQIKAPAIESPETSCEEGWPASCSVVKQNFRTVAVHDLESVPPPVIAANGGVGFGAANLWPFSTVGIGVNVLQSNCIQLAVIVTKIEFSDGSV